MRWKKWTPIAPLGLGKHRHQLLYNTYRLSEAIVNRISAPAVRKVYGIKQAIMIFCQLDMV